jgi:mannose-6-phosphate isomerase-like protein (cupin superfamily)
MTESLRPWGSFTVICTEDLYQIKQLLIKPGKRLSLQSHEFRGEHWYVISGHGIAQVEEEENKLMPGDSISILAGVKHRITNPSNENLIMIEIQTGSSFDEMDIVRYEDDFGRQS